MIFIIKVFRSMSDTTSEVTQSTDSRGYKMICVYDMATGERLRYERSKKQPSPARSGGPADVLRPALQLQEVQLVSRHEPAWLRSDLMLKPVDSFPD
ncbi:hypothetical protein AAY24_12085 [Sedimenticola thiotaurini]|uniref:Uncharacterized protein n=1 Tax=Sedimenticola thiotaurini TaxID=1543721 RepID=A0A0F7K1B6_9GAMM|nr:hypothetical protein AAY24_12085 [Sedimenticola thiotaurini]